jgi:DNA repair protein RecN (Recombination protein N)
MAGVVSDSVRSSRSLLDEISIRNLGVIAEAAVEFAPGLNVITGETGAGKTMVLTALGLVLGAKSDPDLIRSGADRATVTGTFKLSGTGSDELKELFGEHEPDLEDGNLLLTRTISRDGKSRAQLSGQTTTVSVLNQFGGALLQIHGQHGTLALSKSNRQRELLDSYGGTPVAGALTEFRQAAEKYRELAARASELRTALRNRDSEVSSLQELADLYEKLKPKPGELSEISARIERLESVEELRIAASGAYAALDAEETGANTALSNARRALASARNKDGALDELAGRLEDVLYRVADLSSELTSYLESLEADPNQLEELLTRRAALMSFVKRFGSGSDLEEAIASGQNARRRIGDLSGGEERLAGLEQAAAAAFEEVQKAGANLSAARTAAAAKLSQSVILELKELAMPNCAFECRVKSGASTPSELTNHGFDEIEMLFTAHIGGELLPISKAASGGELSRLMLAIEVCISSGAEIGTYLFDEIDAGIGGKAALEVGNRLQRLARSAQVIVVTHLPQVAIWADRHLRVLKDESGSITRSSITLIEGEAREHEIARMLSGLADSEHAQEHARELLGLGRR